MRTIRNASLLFAAILFAANCGGTDTSRFGFLQRPVDLKASSTDITFNGRSTRFVYVADAFSGAVNIVEQLSEVLVDTDAGDEFDHSPLAVGGEPVAIAVQDRAGLSPRIFVADTFNRRLIAYEAVPPADPSLAVLVHQPVNLGAASLGIVTRAMFEDTGRTSTPVLNEVTVNPAVAQNELFEVKFLGDDEGYRVFGSKSGEQTTRAFENKAYTSDNGSITFTIRSGGEKTNEGDLFRFSIVVTNPLVLAGRPVDLQIAGTQLFIITSDPAEVVVLDLDTLTASLPVPLIDGLPALPLPGRTALNNGHLYIPNQASPNLFDMKTSDQTFQVINTGVKARAAGTDPLAQTLYLMPIGARQTALWDLGSNLALPSIRLSDYGFAFGTYSLDGTDYGLVPTMAGGVDLLNVTQRTRVDTRVIDEPTQSQTVGQDFFDVLPVSAPELIAVTTVDGVTRTERWQLTYEGVIPATSLLAATVAADQLTAAGGLFQTWGIQAGDLVTLDPTGNNEAVAVAQVISETVIQLASTPQTQGNVAIEIRPTGSYQVFGSVSGAQKNRVTEGTPYTSDDGSISLTIRASRTQPTTRGDFFTFLTTEGIDPFLAPDKRFGRAVTIFTRPGDTDPTAYIAQQGSGSISILNLRDQRERNTIR